MRDKQSYTGIRIAGILSIILISCLTAFAVNMVLVDINDRADATYRDNLTAVRSSDSSHVESIPQESSSVESFPAVDESSFEESVASQISEASELSEANESSKVVSEVSETSEASEASKQESSEVSEFEESKPETKTEKSKESEESESKSKTKTEESKQKDDKPVSQEVDSDDAIIAKYDIRLDNCSLDSQGNLVYTVQTGDWLSCIAARFHSSVDAIGKRNHIANVDLIYTGDKYVIPVDDNLLQWAKTQLQ